MAKNQYFVEPVIVCECPDEMVKCNMTHPGGVHEN